MTMANYTLQSKIGAVVVPSDALNIPNPSDPSEDTVGCNLFVGFGGDVRVLIGEVDITFKGVASGQFLPIYVTKVFATGTSATDIVALW